MECILKTGTGSATKTKYPKAHTNRLECQYTKQIRNVHYVAANLTFHNNPSSGSFQLLQTGEEMMERFHYALCRNANMPKKYRT